MNEIQVFDRTNVAELKPLGKLNKDSMWFGHFYVVEFGDAVKIGSTNNPYNRYMAFIREGEKYGKSRIGRFGVSSRHTNYRENEKALHKIYADHRRKGTELFDIKFEDAIRIPSQIELLDEAEKKNEKAEKVTNLFKSFVTGDYWK
jgi:hypothetical protein